MISSIAATSRHCTACDTPAPADARFCVECGASLNAVTGEAATQPVPQAQPYRPQAFAPPGQRCPTCAITNPAGAGFCVNCGRSLAAAPAPGYATALATGYPGTIVQNFYVTNAVEPPVPLVVRALWFLFVGLWLGPLWIVLGWLLNLTIVGMPLGLWMLNRTGHVMTLHRGTPHPLPSIAMSGASFAVRGVYFMLIGWWASLVWLMFGWLAAASVIGLPIAFLMFERTGTVMTLAE